MAELLERSRRLLAGEVSTDEHHPLDMSRPVTLEEVGPNLAFVEAFANVAAIETDEGLVLVDASGPLHATAVHEALRGWSTAPLHTAVFTHGHVDHIYAVAVFEAEPDAAPARVVAHEALPARFRRYEMTRGYNAVVNQRQFRLGAPIFPGNYRYPDETYRDELAVSVGGARLELRHDRGETDDGTWVWWEAQKVLCTGDLFIWASPNCGNPQKVQRYCDEWATALRKMAALGPELLLPGHGLPIAGAETCQQVLGETADLLESLFTQTIDLMNEGARLDDIVHTVRAPEHLLDRPWLRPVYDEPEFVVRNIWRLYGGWYDGDPSHLKPAPAAELAGELASLAGGAERLATRALELSDAGEHRLAGHLVELATQASDDLELARARATVFGRRYRAERSTMAKGVFRWAEHESVTTADETDS
ncbi:MAG TPA: alkyl sulfatase dimerization domain-containing protein [Microthrixaceae bacterium]|nr:alkyl sulfatase dimerization domain-containing protein [Microthrixaceae bacterium]